MDKVFAYCRHCSVLRLQCFCLQRKRLLSDMKTQAKVSSKKRKADKAFADGTGSWETDVGCAADATTFADSSSLWKHMNNLERLHSTRMSACSHDGAHL